MKNTVRMRISREMHDWFKSIDAKTNDERMKRVIEFNEAHIDALNDIYILQRNLNESRETSSHKLQMLADCQVENGKLKALLALSITVSIVSVSYLAYVQGWLL